MKRKILVIVILLFAIFMILMQECNVEKNNVREEPMWVED